MKLAEENQAHWESLEMKQEDTSVAVSSLEENLSSVKALMQNCISKAEEELGQLRSWQNNWLGTRENFRQGYRKNSHA